MAARSNLQQVQRVLLVTLALNVAVAVAKGVYGVLSGSLAVASDAVHSMLDAASNVVGWFTTRAADHPPDEGHPYGHRKIEILAATFLGILIAGGALQFGWSAVEALIYGTPPPTIGAGGFVVVGATLVVNVFVAWYEARRGRELNSHFLTADAAHTASDVVVTIGVLISLALTKSGLSWADPVAALLVLAVIAHVAWSIMSANIDILLDRAVYEPEEVRQIVLAVDGVTGCHRVRTRGADTAAHLDLHMQTDGTLTLREAHDISHRVEDALLAKLDNLVDVTIHVEPHDDEEEGL